MISIQSPLFNNNSKKGDTNTNSSCDKPRRHGTVKHEVNREGTKNSRAQKQRGYSLVAVLGRSEEGTISSEEPHRGIESESLTFNNGNGLQNAVNNVPLDPALF